MVLLDTDVLVDLLRKHAPAVEWLKNCTASPVVPGLVVMELVQGCRNAAELRAVQTLVSPMQVVWPTEAECVRALEDFMKFHLSHGLGLLDSLIAACAVGRGVPLYTFNGKHYSMIPDLVIQEPYTR